MLILAHSTVGGERSTGEYAGTVIYDSWDTCYLYSGIYLMYIADRQKDRLREYAGRSIMINATAVHQPINPGDGIISDFEVKGYSRPDESGPDIGDLKLSVAPKFELSGQARFEITIENQAKENIEIFTDSLAPTVFGQNFGSSPSDGHSAAKLTRHGLRSYSRFQSIRRSPSNEPEFERMFAVEGTERIPYKFELKAGGKKRIIVCLNLPTGGYDFLVGYGGGVHDSKGLASNLVPFYIDANGSAYLSSSMPGSGSVDAEIPTPFRNALLSPSDPELFFDFPSL